MAYSAWSVIAGEQPTAAKWNILGTNDASFNDGTGIGTGAITATKIGTDASFAWASWTPTLTNLSGGTLNYSKYIQIGKTIHARFKYTLAGAGVGTSPTITLPVAASADYATSGESFLSTVSFVDLGINFYAGQVFWATSTTVTFRVQTGTTTNGISATIPFTWGTGDYIQAHIVYEAA
jgi:hypothetical protein